MNQSLKKMMPLVATVAAVIAVGSACGKDAATTQVSVATSIVANAGSSGQTGAISGMLAAPISVHVTNQGATAMSGAIVTWSVVAPGGSIDSATSTTNSNGDAITHWTLGSIVGAQSLKATIVGGSFVSITANAVAGASTLLAKVSGDAQTVAGAGTVSAAMVVKLTDALGNPVIGATITWASGSGGTLSATSTTTDATGRAQITVTTAATARLYSIGATASGIVAVTFTMTGT
jgi:Bacterial Ig-like domain (group 1)